MKSIVKNTIICIITSILPLSAGCVRAEQVNDSETAEEELILSEETGQNTEEPESFISNAVWICEPSLELESVEEMTQYLYGMSIFASCYEFTGYPQRWDPECPVEYTENAIVVKKNGRYGVYDYSGNVLYDTVLEPYQSLADENPISYQNFTGYINSVSFSERFSADFRTLNEYAVPGLGGDFGTLALLNGKYVSEFYGMTEPVAFENIGRRMVVENIDHSGNIIGYSVVRENGEIISQINGRPLDFVNGYISVNRKSLDWWLGDSENNKLQIVKAETGESINDQYYNDIKFFECGYCPVKKGTKWGYVNENGEEVTDFIFDDASTLYDGKAYVSQGGLYGVIDLEETIHKVGHLTSMDCYGIDIPQPENTAANSSGTVTVKVTNLNIRRGPGTDYDKNGFAAPGILYDVYEVTLNGGYTWYRIGENEWIADKNGEWVDYSE